MSWALWWSGLMLAAGPSDTNVVLVTVDTLRADRLGLYGYDRPTSPFLDELAGESVVFDRMFAQSSFTPPSHASIFTSLYVRQHGLLTWNWLDEGHVTLAEVLREAGYTTGAVANLGLLLQHNLGQGFEHRDQKDDGAERINLRAKQWLASIRGQKFFLWVHYFDVHAPYARHPGYERYFNEHHNPAVGRHMRYYNSEPATRRELRMTEADVAFIKDRYDGGVAFVDRALLGLVAELKALDVWDRTLLVVTSDHGESLDEHHPMYFTHDPFLYDAVIRIPAVIRFPGGRFGGARVRGMVESVDLAPTILSYLGLAIPLAFEGRDLMPMFRGQSEGREVVFSESWGWRTIKSIRTERWKLLWKIKADRFKLYDLEADAGELRDVSAEHPEVTERLKARLLKWADVEENPVRENPELDEEMRERLRSLGYMREGSQESLED
ncbi:MAG: sulfatase [Phycisphaerales bacterium]|nr:MAG: sulfatase [Phycisphaerales bacterium]